MNERIIMRLPAALVIKEGVSKKTGKPYRMTCIRVATDDYGELDVVLDTNRDRAGIVLDVIARKEEANG